MDSITFFVLNNNFLNNKYEKYIPMTKTVHRIYVGSFFFITIITTLYLAIQGYQYYTTPLVNRFFLPNNYLLKPSGLVGHGLGIIGSLMMIFGVAIYMIRKRVRYFHKFGYLKYWLEFHIFLCTLGPILILFHTAFKFGGIVSVSFWSMVAVVVSGAIGKFIYTQVPHTIQGQMISLHELNSLNENLSYELKNQFELSDRVLSKIDQICSIDRYKRIKFGASMALVLHDYFGTKNVLSMLKKELRVAKVHRVQRKKILKTAKDKLQISRRIGLLNTTQKILKYWHVIHLPFAIIMFIIMFVHIAVEIIFGYTWIFR